MYSLVPRLPTFFDYPLILHTVEKSVRPGNEATTHRSIHSSVQDKTDWTICGDLKGRIETFKRTMPLIQDLKNPAMRDRHWQQLKDEIQKPFEQTSELWVVVLGDDT